MKLKPSRDKVGVREGPKLDGIGNVVRKGDERNPFATLARGLNPQGEKRRRPMADTLGATPPRDGPFAMAAADIAVQKPPRARQRRSRSASTTWLR